MGQETPQVEAPFAVTLEPAEKGGESGAESKAGDQDLLSRQRLQERNLDVRATLGQGPQQFVAVAVDLKQQSAEDDESDRRQCYVLPQFLLD